MPRLPFQTIQRLDLPITEVVSGRIGCIHDPFLTFAYEVCEALPKENRDFGGTARQRQAALAAARDRRASGAEP
jgi:hypothetical protein